MKYRLKLFVTLLVALLLLNTVLFFSLRSYMDRLMLGLEKEEAHQAITRVLNALDREVDTLNRLNIDWAVWDDSYAFMLDHNADYLTSNLVDSSFTANHLDLIIYLDTAGQPFYQRAYDSEKDEPMAMPESLLPTLQANPELWRFQEFGESQKGFLRLSEGVLMISAQPIVDSNGEGPVRGTLLMGRLFSQHEHDELQELTKLSFRLSRLPETTATQSQAHQIRVQETDNRSLTAATVFSDLLGTPVWRIESRFPRNFYHRGLQSLNTFMLWNLAITTLLAFIVGLIIDKLAAARLGLLESEKRYRDLSLELQTILDGISGPVFLVSDQRQVVWTNQAGSNIFGQPPSERPGKTRLGIPFRSFSEENRCPISRALASGKQKSELAKLDDGRIMTLEAFPLIGKQKRILGAIGVMTDISEQVRQQDEAEQRNRLTVLGELAAGIAHDINNPVGMLQINLPMIKDTFKDFCTAVSELPAAQEREYGGLSFEYIKEKLPFLIDEMLNNTRKIRKMTEELKGFSRRQTEPEVGFRLEEVVDSTLRLVNYNIIKATDHFSCQLEKDLPLLRGCPYQLEQVLINLLLNACQALKSRDQAIRLEAFFDNSANQVVIEIKDAGVGICQEHLGEITKPFFTTRGSQGGSGLGLSIAERIIKQHKGKLEITSEPGLGTCARVILPVRSGK